MPYEVKKVKGGWKVRNKQSGKFYSKKPMTNKAAMAQLRALYANTKD